MKLTASQRYRITEFRKNIREIQSRREDLVREQEELEASLTHLEKEVLEFLTEIEKNQ
jgi:hypothetical protein